MNREILFRAKRMDNGEWVEGNLIVDPKGFCYIARTHNIFDFEPIIFVDKDTVCQYTGLKDKNGNKVFEGDVVKTKYGRVCRVTSICCEGYVGFDLDALETEHKMPTEYDLFASRNIEVIGNIFDNKELLDKPTDRR